MAESAFDPLSLLQTLDDHGVRYVVIGGLAAVTHGSPVVTYDVDVCYARDDDNLERLAAALRDLHARLRGAPADVPFRLDAETIASGDHFTFDTDVGPFDILGTPAGAGGFDVLMRNAVEVDLDGLTIQVAALADLIRMKEAAGRPKDVTAIEHLRALQEESEDDEI